MKILRYAFFVTLKKDNLPLIVEKLLKKKYLFYIK